MIPFPSVNMFRLVTGCALNAVMPIVVWWRGVWDLNPRGPKDHRLSRPAPYQARATPQR